MPDDPFYIKVLEKLGFNTTQLRWRIYRAQQNAQRARERGVTPTGLKWLQYEHKICRRCGAVNDREARQCHRCQRKLPGMLGYRLFRIGGLMFPENAPAVSSTFLVVMVGVYAAMLLLDGVSFRSLFSPSTNVLYLFGTLSNNEPFYDVEAVRHSYPSSLEWWRWLAFGVVHFGIIHIAFNAFALTQIGPLIEGEVGRYRLLVIITVCQVAAALATYYWYMEIRVQGFRTAGASGWVFGLIGFGTAYFHRMGDRARAYRNVLFQWVVYALLFGIIIRANNAAHIGGMLAGAAMAYLPEVRGGDRVQRSEYGWAIGFWVCVLLWASALLYMGYFVVTHLEILRES